MTTPATDPRHRLLLKDDDEILEFITGGKAIFTVKNRDSGARATYRVEASGDGADRANTVRAFTGSDNALKGSYTLMGTLDSDGRWTARTALSEADALIAAIKVAPKRHWVDNKPGFLTRCRELLVKGLALSKNQAYRYNGAVRKYGVGGFITDKIKLVIFPWTWGRLVSGKGLPGMIEFWHEGCCRRCAARLTVPASIELGCGPDCATHMGCAEEWVLLDKKLGRDLEAYGAALALRNAR